MCINAVADSVTLQLYLRHYFYNTFFKIKHKLYTASGSAPPPGGPTPGARTTGHGGGGGRSLAVPLPLGWAPGLHCWVRRWLIGCILLQVRSDRLAFIWLDDGAATGQVGAVMWRVVRWTATDVSEDRVFSNLWVEDCGGWFLKLVPFSRTEQCCSLCHSLY
jgi:hypothetical protein